MFSLFKLGSEKMKVFKTIFLCVVLIFALAGCGNSHAEADNGKTGEWTEDRWSS